MLNKRKCWNVKCDDSSGKESKLQRNVEKEQQQQQHWKNLSEEKRRLFWKTHLEKNQCIIGELNKQNWLKNLERT